MWGETDTSFYRYTVIVCAITFLLALVHFVIKPGRAWAAIRESEPAALAAGVNITLYKMWAFALASFMTGVAGGLLAAQVGNPTVYGFPTQDSLTLIATALIGGIFTLWGAVVAGTLHAARALHPRDPVERRPELAADHLRSRPAPGAPDRTRRDRPATARRTSRTSGVSPPARSASLPRRTPLHDRGGEPHRALRRRDPDRRRHGDLPRRHLRPDRPERRRQDDLLQRAERVREAGLRHDPGVRRRPAEDGRLPPRPLGTAADVPDRAGDRAAVGVRQRGDDPRALEGGALVAPRGRSGRDRLRRPRCSERDRRRAQRARPSARRARTRGRRQARGWCSSTSLPRASPTRRPSTWAT